MIARTTPLYPDAAPLLPVLKITGVQKPDDLKDERSIVLAADYVQQGRHYHLCVDLDGIGGADPGDAGLAIYVSPANDAGSPPGVLHVADGAAPSLDILLDGCHQLAGRPQACSNNSLGYLASECAAPFGLESSPSELRPLLLKNQQWWLQVPSELSALLEPFALYKACLDADGIEEDLKLGDTGLSFYVSGIRGQNLTLRKHLAEPVHVRGCRGCTNMTEFRLAATCDRTNTRGALPAVPGASTSATRLDTENEAELWLAQRAFLTDSQCHPQ
jgi:hypothetical protein